MNSFSPQVWHIPKSIQIGPCPSSMMAGFTSLSPSLPDYEQYQGRNWVFVLALGSEPRISHRMRWMLKYLLKRKSSKEGKEERVKGRMGRKKKEMKIMWKGWKRGKGKKRNKEGKTQERKLKVQRQVSSAEMWLIRSLILGKYKQ